MGDPKFNDSLAETAAIEADRIALESGRSEQAFGRGWRGARGYGAQTDITKP